MIYQQFKKGIDEYIDEIQEIVEYIKNPQQYIQIGAQIPKGILLVGKAGVGKTLLAKALANESNCKFKYISSSSLISSYNGGSAQNIKRIFEEAKQYIKNNSNNNSSNNNSSNNYIIFFDEFDSIANKRSNGNNNNENMSTNNTNEILNELLVQMDGFNNNHNIFIIAATNFISHLDDAILRAGRFDKIINIPQPSMQGRKQIIQYYLSKIQYNKFNIDINKLAQMSINYTGSDIRTWINLTILNVIKQNKQEICMQDFDYSIDRMNIGIINKSLQITQDEKLMTAIHEIGHAIISIKNKNAFQMNKVTILSKGGSLGHTSFIPERDYYFITKEQIQAQLDVAMGGRIAEEIFYGNNNITTGCGSDLQQATQNAYKMISKYAMGNNIMIQEDYRQYSEYYKKYIDIQVQKELQESYNRTKKIIIQNKDIIYKFAQKLVEEETMDIQKVKEYLKI